MYANQANQRDYDIPSSQNTQTEFNKVAGELERLINQRDHDVKAAMADYFADGSSEEYAAKEQRWNRVADEVKMIIHVLRGSLSSTDETAGLAMKQAGVAVDNIGAA